MPTPDGTSATRGDLAFAIFKALGLTETSGDGRFSDGGYMSGMLTTLADLGITNGIGGGKFGTTNTTTRGEAFTMIARALGLADKDTSIAQASQALVDAGIVKGYGNDPGNLGLNDPLRPDHLNILVGRVSPEITKKRPDGSSIASDAATKTSEAASLNKAKQDPAYAAYLASVGVRRDQINDEIALRDQLFTQDSRMRSETYGRAAEQGVDGARMDFENRGLFKSGTRVGKEADVRAQVGYQAAQAALQAQMAKEQADMSSRRALADLDADAANAEVQSDEKRAADDTRRSYIK